MHPSAPFTHALFPVARPALLPICMLCVGKPSATWLVQPAHCSVGNADTAVINIFSLRKTYFGRKKIKHRLFIRIFLHQNSFAIIIKSHLLLSLQDY